MYIKSYFGANSVALITKYNPSTQVKAAENLKASFTGSYPTLSELKRVYGSGTAVAWLIPQITDFSEYCGKDGKLDKFQIEGLANTIAVKFFYLKITELMVFFFNLKSGQYGKVFGKNIDPIDICCKLRQFIRYDRNAILDEHKNE